MFIVVTVRTCAATFYALLFVPWMTSRYPDFVQKDGEGGREKKGGGREGAMLQWSAWAHHEFQIVPVGVHCIIS